MWHYCHRSIMQMLSVNGFSENHPGRILKTRKLETCYLFFYRQRQVFPAYGAPLTPCNYVRVANVLKDYLLFNLHPLQRGCLQSTTCLVYDKAAVRWTIRVHVYSILHIDSGSSWACCAGVLTKLIVWIKSSGWRRGSLRFLAACHTRNDYNGCVRPPEKRASSLLR